MVKGKKKGGNEDSHSFNDNTVATSSLFNQNTGSTGAVPLVKKQTLKEDLIVRSIKILDIGYINFLYAIPALFVAVILDKHVYKHINIGKEIKKDEDKTVTPLLIETILCLGISGIIAYILRNLLQLIPFPLENVYGFQHMRVSEVKGGGVISMFLLWFSPTLLDKVDKLKKKFGALV